MTLGVLVLRKGFLKVLGSVIQAAVDRRHRVVLLWDPEEKKPGERLSESDFRHWPVAVRSEYRRTTPLLPALRKHGVQALVAPSLEPTLSATGIEAEVGAIHAAGIRLFSFDYVFETLTSEVKGYELIDRTFYTSNEQRSLHWRLLREQGNTLPPDAELETRSAVCGSTMTDQLAAVDRKVVRRWLGVGDTQPVVVFMSLKMAVPDPWRQFVWGRGPAALRKARAWWGGRADLIRQIRGPHGYRDLMRALRAFCDRHGAALIVKSREKNEDPPFVERLASTRLIYDEHVYPYTSMQLMAIASLCVHFQSGAVLEAAFANVPSLSLSISQEHLRGYVSYDEVYGGGVGSMQNFPGIVWPLEGTAAAARLATASLDDFRVDPDARRRYVEKFLGFDDTRSSGRVLDRIERDVSAGGAAAARPASDPAPRPR